MCRWCSYIGGAGEVKLIDMLDWYRQHFNLEVSGIWSSKFDTATKTELLREAMLTNTPVADYLYDTYNDEKYRLEKSEWHEAIKRYMNHFELRVPAPNKWSHRDTIQLIDEAIESNTPLDEDYKPIAA